MATKATPTIGEQDISDSYMYLLGRLLITRQQQLDFEEGFKWNELLHRKPGQVDWPNPNLDVAYSEAWVALDEKGFLFVTVPEIKDRYYVVEFLNGWGETVANINERVYPDHPNGLFAVCLKGSNVEIPAGAQRVDVPVKVMRTLLRVELGPVWDDSIALQKQFKFEMKGNPALPEVPKTVMFDMEALPGVEAFESAELALDSEQDINPGMENLQASVLTIAQAVKDLAERDRIDKVIRQKALPEFAAAVAMVGRGTKQNHWVRPSCCGHFGNDWLSRTVINFAGIWANVFEEVIYYSGSEDSTGAPLDLEGAYSVTFPANDLPAKYGKYFWSIIALDRVHRRILPNTLNRYLLNKESNLTYGEDRSLTLYFAAEKPANAPEGNWLPTKGKKPWKLTFRFYGPRGGVADGTYYPPALQKVN